jgi:hypothetical protein
MLYVQGSGGLFAVLARGPVFADLREESTDLLSHYGGNVEAVSHLLSLIPVSLSPALLKWGTLRDVPAADIGVGTPVLISIDGAFQLALSWRFDSARAYATTYRGAHITVIAPAQLERIELAHTQAPTALSEGPMAT